MSEPMMTRHEPQSLTERAFPRDPYAAWLEQREADRQRDEDTPIRWVYRPRIVGDVRAAV